MSSSGAPFKIFVADDNSGDLQLFRAALGEWKTPYELVTARDGEEAFKILSRPGYLPDLIILDIKMPKVDGFEVLENLRKHNLFTTTPTLILSSSTSERDIDRARHFKVNEYLQKPTDFDVFVSMVKRLEIYATRTV